MSRHIDKRTRATMRSALRKELLQQRQRHQEFPAISVSFWTYIAQIHARVRHHRPARGIYR
ncbi:hypothetical protein JJC00_26290 [Bradyrhizobium diazoefficiens]|uniref:hypothetical protein n=1 Tax=Bradyrhizobium diazoefficiens TaxID=1355477 RepID=UPI00190CC708|nr:hypothetical protein [Bradyrhizobium diazoefficiens]QQO32085.1 hypothetical protein JJC00_26290 [Bradyrhizobium diazoefficiens]